MKPGGENIYTAYRDNSSAVKVKVAVPGSNWLDLSFPATGSVQSGCISVAIAPTIFDGEPIVAYRDPLSSPVGRIRIYKYNGPGWGDLGYASADAGERPKIAVDTSTGYPVVAYMEISTSKIRLKKYNGSTWVDYGYVPGAYGFLHSIASEPSGERMTLLLVWQSGGYNPERVFRRVVY
jgi:hypothetical protein